MSFSPEDSATLIHALLQAHASGDDAAGKRIASLSPEQLTSILNGERQEALVDKLVTVHGPHGTFQRHQKVSTDPDSTGPVDRTSAEPPHPDHVLDGLAEAVARAAPEAAKSRGLLHRFTAGLPQNGPDYRNYKCSLASFV